MKKTIKLDSNSNETSMNLHREDDYKLIFTVIEGSEIDFGKVYNFNKNSVEIGRGKSNDIVVNDEKISRKHCRISVIDTGDREQIVIEDLGSTNGTLVNDESISKEVLKTGDKIGLGSTIIRFSYSDLIEEQYRSRLYNLATIDALTGLYNKRFIMSKLESQNRIAKRNQRVYSLVLIDIDNFKLINDRYGHPAGDEYLKMFARVVNHVLREQDIGGRFGGEEFIIILPETEQEGALSLTERIRNEIEESKLVYKKNVIQSTISAGVAQFPLHGNEVTQLIKKVDEAMYQAKIKGKNRIALAKEDN